MLVVIMKLQKKEIMTSISQIHNYVTFFKTVTFEKHNDFQIEQS